MKIAFLITGLNYGGAETQLVHLATRLKKRGWDVQVISMIPPVAYVEELKRAGIHVYSLEMRRGVPDPRGLFRLVKILRRERPQILHCHMVHANLLGRISRIFVKTPVLICSVHSIIEGGRQREIAYRFTDWLCDLTTQVSRAGLERYVQIGAVPRQKIRYIPNGVDTEIFKPDLEARLRLRKDLRVEDKFVWLAVGRFEKAKDYSNMLNAFAKVVSKRKDSVLLIAGQGSLMEKIKHLAGELGITHQVYFLGVRKDVPELMNAADAYVMSSSWEGMPLVLLEASAVGLPIVATDVGGNKEIVVDGESGFLVLSRNPESLAQAMLKLMDLPEGVRKAMGRAGRKYIEENYSLEHVVDIWEELYIEFLKNKRITR
jgi:glycosyltransferase involved in cell wall biosynthesis